MGSPVKVPQADSAQPQSNQGRGKRDSFQDKWYMIFYPAFIGMVVLAMIFLYIDPKIPPLDSKVFEALVQVIAIFIGFSIVGFFYHLGKIDDRRNESINSLTSYVNIEEKFISDKKPLLERSLNAVWDSKDNAKINEAKEIQRLLSVLLEDDLQCLRLQTAYLLLSIDTCK